MALSDVLAQIPGRGAYLAQQEHDQRQAMGQFQQLSGLAAMLQRQQEFQHEQELRPLKMEMMRAQMGELQRKAAQQQAIEDAIGKMPPEAQAIARLNPQAFVSNMLKSEEVRTVAPGAALVRGSEVIYQNPGKEKDDRHSFEKLLDAAGVADPKRRQELLGQYINKQATHQAPVNVYSSSMVPAVDAGGRDVYVQPSQREGTQPRVVQGLYPPPRGEGGARGGQSAATLMGEYQATDELISGMIRSIQSGNPIGMVGVPGMVAQGVETVTGTVKPNAPSPAIDLRAQKEQLIDKMRSLATRKDSNFSNKDAERYENMLGFDKALITSGATVRALTNLQNDLRRRRMNIDVRPREVAGPRVIDFNSLPER